jgi:hypothetical protein
MGNSASGLQATVAGGKSNTAGQRLAAVGGGQGNTAGGAYSTVSGGSGNVVTATGGTIPGGVQNYVGGQYGFAAGFGARAEHQGSFVWSSSQGTSFASTGSDQFLIDASGGVGIGTNSPSHMLTVAGSASITGGAAITVGVILNHDMLQNPSAVYAGDDLLYVTSSSTNTLSIWNVSKPPDHALIGATTAQLSGPTDVQVVGELAYAVSLGHERLAILDVSDPANPDARGSTSENLTNPRAVHVSGKYAYVASGGDSKNPLTTFDGLAIFDVTEPWSIVATSFITTHLQGTSDVFVSGSYAHVTSEANNRLVVFDVSDPHAPTPVSYTEVLSAPVQVHVSGIYAYVVARDSNELVVFDVSDPTQIVKVGQVAPDLAQARSVYVSGDRAYVAYAGAAPEGEQCGLAVLDISDPASIAELNVIDMSDWLMWIAGGTVQSPTLELLPPKPVAVTGNGEHLYLANEWHDSVTVFEVNYLEAPVVKAGELQAAHLEVTDDAMVDGELSVRGGLNVGRGGALLQGALSVQGPGDSYIQGRLGIGPVSTAITVGESITDYHQYTLFHPTHQLDVDGEARFRVNDYTHLVLRSPNIPGVPGSDDDAYIDFVPLTYPDLITPSARIAFHVTNPVTHAAQIAFYTKGEDDEYQQSRLEIESGGNVRPGENNAYTLGIEEQSWQAVYAYAYVTSSDGRYKENISALPYGLDAVTALRPVSFNWADRPDDGLHYGLIAQEVREVLPEVVVGDDGENGTLSMNYGELVPVLVNAIQEQQAEIDIQAEQIAALEARLLALEDRQPGQEARPGGMNAVTMLGFGGVALGAVVVVGLRRKGGKP